jgi:hypothetical protein
VPVKQRQIALLGREACRSARTAPIAIKIWRFRLVLGLRPPDKRSESHLFYSFLPILDSLLSTQRDRGIEQDC